MAARRAGKMVEAALPVTRPVQPSVDPPRRTVNPLPHLEEANLEQTWDFIDPANNALGGAAARTVVFATIHTMFTATGMPPARAGSKCARATAPMRLSAVRASSVPGSIGFSSLDA